MVTLKDIIVKVLVESNCGSLNQGESDVRAALGKSEIEEIMNRASMKVREDKGLTLMSGGSSERESHKIDTKLDEIASKYYYVRLSPTIKGSNLLFGDNDLLVILKFDTEEFKKIYKGPDYSLSIDIHSLTSKFNEYINGVNSFVFLLDANGAIQELNQNLKPEEDVSVKMTNADKRILHGKKNNKDKNLVVFVVKHNINDSTNIYIPSDEQDIETGNQATQKRLGFKYNETKISQLLRASIGTGRVTYHAILELVTDLNKLNSLLSSYTEELKKEQQETQQQQQRAEEIRDKDTKISAVTYEQGLLLQAKAAKDERKKALLEKKGLVQARQDKANKISANMIVLTLLGGLAYYYYQSTTGEKGIIAQGTAKAAEYLTNNLQKSFFFMIIIIALATIHSFVSNGSPADPVNLAALRLWDKEFESDIDSEPVDSTALKERPYKPDVLGAAKRELEAEKATLKAIAINEEPKFTSKIASRANEIATELVKLHNVQQAAALEGEIPLLKGGMNKKALVTFIGKMLTFVDTLCTPPEYIKLIEDQTERDYQYNSYIVGVQNAIKFILFYAENYDLQDDEEIEDKSIELLKSLKILKIENGQGRGGSRKNKKTKSRKSRKYKKSKKFRKSRK
jgi:hypothetical protein